MAHPPRSRKDVRADPEDLGRRERYEDYELVVSPLLSGTYDRCQRENGGGAAKHRDDYVCLDVLHVAPYLIHFVPAPTTDTKAAMPAVLPSTDTINCALTLFMIPLPGRVSDLVPQGFITTTASSTAERVTHGDGFTPSVPTRNDYLTTQAWAMRIARPNQRESGPPGQCACPSSAGPSARQR